MFVFKLSDSSYKLRTFGKNNDSLLVDTGATSHIIIDKSKFVTFDNNFDPGAHLIELADGNKANIISGKGSTNVKLYNVSSNSRDILLKNVLYVPSYKQDIFSVCAAVEQGGSISLKNADKEFWSPDGSTFNIEQVGRLYY